MRCGLYFLALALVSCASAPPPPEDPQLRELVDAAVRPFLDSRKHMGLVVGVIHGGRSRVLGYGRMSVRDSTPPGGDTIFEIGSITKAFTGTLLLQSGLNLDDPVGRHMFPEVLVPAKRRKEFTLLHLATHRSGLPRLPPSLAPKDSSNPYADYTVDDLYHDIRTCELERDPGTAYEYSNLGMGLLGRILEVGERTTYEHLVADQICRPLKMNDTVVTLTADQKRRLAPGHLPDGTPTANWDLPALAGAGALRSTADDMVRFLKANLGGAYGGAHVPRASIGRGESIGLAWHLTPLTPGGPTMIWHNGGTGGYRSFAGFVKQTRTAVVVLSNSASETDSIGVTLLTLLQNVK